MALSRKPLIVFVFLFLFLFSKYSDSLKLVTELIHHDSKSSPFYNASETIADRTWRATGSSLARHTYLSAQSSPSDISPGIEARLAVSKLHTAFYVKFAIGSPPVQQLAIMDTGSDYLWLKCLPCDPCRPMLGISYFDPAESSSFVARTCTKDCDKCTGRYPWSPKACAFDIDYVGGTRSEGFYATDQISFRSTNDLTITIEDIQFGCSTSQGKGRVRIDQAFNGVFGLGLGDPRAALLSQHTFLNEFDFKFSYCTGSLFESFDPINRLAFGDAAVLQGKPTPFHTDYNTYDVQIVNITLGEKTLPIDNKVYRAMAHRKRVVIDSGATLTHLYSEAYKVLRTEIVKQAKRKLVKKPAPGKPFELCYLGNVDDTETMEFPTLGFHFADGASMEVNHRGLFRQVEDDTFCLAVVRSDSISLIGIMAQQHYNVGFDLRSRMMYLQYVDDCSVLHGG